METYIKISNLNDFIFCPKSIYFHNLYDGYHYTLYKQKPQIVGTIKHENIDRKKYSTEKKYLQSLDIYSEKYGICGKIDVYDADAQTIIERKNKISVIYDGYRYQLYAQYFCLTEMEYPVKQMFFHSLSDNKRYEVSLPGECEIAEFEHLLAQMRSFNPDDPAFFQNPEKCKMCIYAPLCDVFVQTCKKR